MEDFNKKQNRANSQSEAWESLKEVSPSFVEKDIDGSDKKIILSTAFESMPKTKFETGSRGEWIAKEDQDSVQDAKEREAFYKSNPGAKESDAMYARLKEMDENPDRFDRFEGEHIRGARNRGAEYVTGNGMYAAAPDGGKLNNATRKEMARMMHDAEDFQAFEQGGRYKDYIERERAKIGSVYKNKDDFNHKMVARLKKFEQNKDAAPEDSSAEDGSQSAETSTDESGNQGERSPDGTFQPPALPELPDNNFYPPAVLQEDINADFQPPAVVEQDADQNTEDENASENTSEQEGRQELAKRAIDNVMQYGMEEINKLEEAFKNGDFDKKEFRARGEALVYYLWNRLDAVRNDYPGVDDRRLHQADEIIANLLAKYNASTEGNTAENPAIEQQPDVLALEDKQGNIIDGQGRIVDNKLNKDELIDKAKQEMEAKEKLKMMEKSKEALNEALKEAKKASQGARAEHLKNAEAALEKLKNLNNGKEKNNETREREIQELEEEIKEAKKNLEEAEGDLAESYAKNRRLLVGNKNRTEYINNKQKYGEKLSDYLRLQARLTFMKGDLENARQIQADYNKLAQEISEGKTTAGKAGEALGDRWEALSRKLQTKISTEFVNSFLEENKNLEDRTIDRIDNGSLYRKVVSKIIDNKALKVAVGAAGVAGLAITGVGIATGAVAATIGYTGVGAALGAGRGAIGGAIMSRQSSKNSAVRGFVDQDQIRSQLESIDAVNNDKDVKNVTDWLMKQYDAANQADRSSNRKRTLIATGLGAAIGALASGVRINKVTSKHKSYDKIIGHEPTEEHAALINDIEHRKGYGTQQLFRELNGDGDTYFSSGAHDIMTNVVKKYGLTVGVDDLTYPGKISDWPETARAAFTEVADEWAKNGLVDSIKTGGRPIYDSYGYTVNKLIADKIRNIFTQAGATALGGAIGGAISRARNRIRNPEPMPNTTPPAQPEQAPAQPAQPEQAPAQQPEVPDIPITDYETPPADDTIVPVYEGAQPDQAPAQPAQPEQAPAEDYDTATRNTFQGRVNDDILNYMTSDSEYNGLDGNMMQGRLMDMPLGVRREVADYMDSHADQQHGRALRQVIDLMRQNGQI